MCILNDTLYSWELQATWVSHVKQKMAITVQLSNNNIQLLGTQDTCKHTDCEMIFVEGREISATFVKISDEFKLNASWQICFTLK